MKQHEKKLIIAMLEEFHDITVIRNCNDVNGEWLEGWTPSQLDELPENALTYDFVLVEAMIEKLKVLL